MPDADEELSTAKRATFRARFINDERDAELAKLLERPQNDPERMRVLAYLNDLSPEEQSRFRDKYGLSEDYLLVEGLETPLAPVTVPLDDLDEDAFIEYTLRRAAMSTTLVPKLNSRLAAKFAQVAVSLPASPLPPLPDAAPRLWADRDPGTKATRFLRETYAPWIEAGVLSRTKLRELDQDLYQAYFVRAGRHPDEAVTFAESAPKNFIADPQEAIDRRRASTRAAMARLKAKKDSLSHDID